MDTIGKDRSECAIRHVLVFDPETADLLEERRSCWATAIAVFRLARFGELRWWLLACAPALFFSAGALVRWGRDRLAGLAAAIFVALVAIDAVLIAVATSNLLAS
jgi:hypothetical protein